MSWTDERIETLRKLWLEGLSASKIAGVLGCAVTRNAVIGKVHRLGLSGRVTPSRTVGTRRPRNRGDASQQRRVRRLVLLVEVVERVNDPATLRRHAGRSERGGSGSSVCTNGSACACAPKSLAGARLFASGLSLTGRWSHGGDAQWSLLPCIALSLN